MCHPDHTLGNAAFAALEPRPRFVGHARLKASLAARAPFYREALARELGIAAGEADIVYPELEVERTAELDLGGRRLMLRAWPTAHTDNDLTVMDDASATLFAGDLLFIGHLPVIDGRLVGWLEVMDQLGGLEAKRMVPGHGAPTADWRAALDKQRHYLAGVRDGVRGALADKRTIADAVESLASHRHRRLAADGGFPPPQPHRRLRRTRMGRLGPPARGGRMNTLRSLLHAALLAAVVALGLAGPALAQQQSDPDNPEANATWQQMRTTMFQDRAITTPADAVLTLEPPSARRTPRSCRSRSAPTSSSVPSATSSACT